MKTKQVPVDRKSTLNVDFLLDNDEKIAQETFGKFFASTSPYLSRVNQEDLKHFILAIRSSYIYFIDYFIIYLLIIKSIVSSLTMSIT